MPDCVVDATVVAATSVEAQVQSATQVSAEIASASSVDATVASATAVTANVTPASEVIAQLTQATSVTVSIQDARTVAVLITGDASLTMDWLNSLEVGAARDRSGARTLARSAVNVAVPTDGSWAELPTALVSYPSFVDGSSLEIAARLVYGNTSGNATTFSMRLVVGGTVRATFTTPSLASIAADATLGFATLRLWFASTSTSTQQYEGYWMTRDSTAAGVGVLTVLTPGRAAVNFANYSSDGGDVEVRLEVSQSTVDPTANVKNCSIRQLDPDLF